MDFVNGKWQFVKDFPGKKERVGTQEESMKGVNVEQAKQGRRQLHMKEM